MHPPFSRSELELLAAAYNAVEDAREHLDFLAGKPVHTRLTEVAADLYEAAVEAAEPAESA